MTRRDDIIVDPPRYCEQCGAEIVRTRMPNGEWMARSVFLKRKFCGKACMAEAYRSRPVKTVVQHSAAHRRARRIKQPGPCERCGRQEARDVHHLDGNWLNNEPSNLERICRSCHLKDHRPAGWRPASQRMCGV